MTRAQRKEEGRQDILRAAAALLAERGYHGMSMRDLEQATGMSLANLYNYFRSKEDLLFALQTRSFETLITSAEETVAVSARPEERLHAFILNHVRYVTAHRDIMRVLVEEAGELPARRRHAVRGMKERYFRLGLEVARAVTGAASPRAGAAAPDEAALERAAYNVFGMLNWVYAWYSPERHGTPQDVARTIHRFALAGLHARVPQGAALGATERRVARVAVRSPVRIHPTGPLRPGG